MSDHAPPHRAFEVDGAFDGWRLDRFLAARVPRLSRSKAARICRDAVWLDPPRKVKPSTALRAGDVVFLRRPDAAPDGAAMLPRVVAAGARFAVLDKPAGLLVHPTAQVYSNTVSRLLSDGRVEGCPTRAEPAHRLDRETSGALLVGFDPEAVALLRGLFADDASSDRLRKRYLAVVHDPDGRWRPGQPPEDLTQPLGFDPRAQVRLRMGIGDLPAHTRVETLRRGPSRALVRCTLFTGRQHQIRAHLALQGTPLLGDKLYHMGDAFFLDWLDRPEAPDLRARLSWPRHALHAACLAWRCPWSGAEHDVRVPLPDDMPPCDDAPASE